MLPCKANIHKETQTQQPACKVRTTNNQKNNKIPKTQRWLIGDYGRLFGVSQCELKHESLVRREARGERRGRERVKSYERE